MKIQIDEVPTSGLRLRWDEPAASLDDRLRSEPGAARSAGVRASAARTGILADLRVARAARALAAVGRVEAAVALECARCLASVETRLGLDAALLFVPARAGSHGGDDALGSLDLSGLPFEVPGDGLEVLDYDGSVIDLGHAMVDQVVLALPLAPLCQESCQGLCPDCGQDLNVARCGCAGERIDPRFAALKNLKLSR